MSKALTWTVKSVGRVADFARDHPYAVVGGASLLLASSIFLGTHNRKGYQLTGWEPRFISKVAQDCLG